MGTLNYFNYFTEIEEYFWRKRGAHLLVSPLDWAIIETWQKSGIPVEAVLKGIDRAFESYKQSRRGASGRPLKSLAYCTDSVLEAGEEMREAAAGKGPERDDGGAGQGRRGSPQSESFPREELRAYFDCNIATLARAAQKTGSSASLAARIEDAGKKLAELLPILDSPAAIDLEDLERRLTVLEEKLTASLTAGAAEELLLAIRRDMDRALGPHRRRMRAEHLALLERQYMQKRLFEQFGVPRLSLFYLA